MLFEIPNLFLKSILRIKRVFVLINAEGLPEIKKSPTSNRWRLLDPKMYYWWLILI